MRLKSISTCCFTLILLLLGATFTASANSNNEDRAKYAAYDLHAPLGIPLLLAGNFCELRSNHFHTGLDIKTMGVEGKNVYSISDGYVSRIKISHWGYGRVIYVRHPNGLTSVYAHLQRFNDRIEAIVEAAQYKKESFEIELFPGSDEIKVEKGEIIAISGNSGSSTAPHLHFEIRETKTENPLNVLLFDFKIEDTIEPTLKNVRVYPLTDSSYVDQQNAAKSFKLSGSIGKYKAKDADTLKVHGEIGFAIEVIDKLNGARNPCGIYTIELYVDDEQVYGQRMDHMNFSVNRYLNALTDYEQMKRNKKHFHRSFLLPNNKLPIYENVKNRGHIKFTDNAVHTVKYVIQDTYGNESTASFVVQSVAKADHAKWAAPKETFHQLLKWDQENILRADDEFVLQIPPNILYDDLEMKFSKGDVPKRALAPLWKLHNSWTPMQSYCSIKIKVDSIPPGVAPSKLIVVSMSSAGNIYNEKGKYKDGWMSARTRSFGNYTVMLDTTKPVIAAQNIDNGKSMKGVRWIDFTIKDNLSGIKKYRGTIDGKYVRFEYDPVEKRLRYTFDHRVGTGTHQLELSVYDERGNLAKYSASFSR